MKTILNIIFLLLLGVSLYFIPVNTYIFNFDVSHVFDGQIESKDRKIECVFSESSADDLMISPDKYVIKIKSNYSFESDIDDNLSLSLDITDLLGNSKKINKETLKYTKEINDDELSLSIDISSESLNLMKSNYKLNLSISCLSNNFNDEFNVFYQKDDIITQSSLGIKKTKNMNKFYYSDLTQRYSIPVYKEYLRYSNEFANILYSMSDESEKIEANSLKPFPLKMDFRPRMWFNNGALRCGIVQDNIINIKTKEEAEDVIQNILNSFSTDATGYYIVNEITFFMFDGTGTDIKGYSLENKFNVKRKPCLYIPMFNKQNSYYWAPIEMDEIENVEDSIKYIFDIYKSVPEKVDDNRMISLCPNINPIKIVRLVNDTVVLELSDEYYDFLNSNKIYAEMIKEALSITLPTLDGIESFEFWYHGKLLQKISDVKLGSEIKNEDGFNFLQD